MDTTGTPANTQPSHPAGGFRQKLFNLVGWAAFALLVPPVLQMFGMPQAQDIVGRLGAWGTPVALIGYFYGILFLRVFFGSDQRYTPVIIGYALSFLYFSAALDIGFMRWLYNLVMQVPALSHPAFNLAAGIIVVFLANAMSGFRKARAWLDAIVLGVLPAAALVAAGLYLPPVLGL